MEHRRYGEFRFNDYCASWIGIAALLIFAVVSLALKLHFLLAVFPSLYAIIWIWTVLAPNIEKFSISSEKIIVKKGRKKEEIPIPSKLCLVVSNVDICPPLAIRTPTGNETHILKDKYAVSVLKAMPLEDALMGLHRNNMHKYTTSTIQRNFDDCRYIYCFVCDRVLLDKLIDNRECQLIIPESLLERVPINRGKVNLHIDVGY